MTSSPGAPRPGVFGLLLFVWFSTRLIGSLRSVLREVFDLQEDRGIIQGKIFDAVMVAGRRHALPVEHRDHGCTRGDPYLRCRVARHRRTIAEVRWFQAVYGQLLAFGFIFLMFALMYRYLPARSIAVADRPDRRYLHRVVWELLKAAFAWYVANVRGLHLDLRRAGYPDHPGLLDLLFRRGVYPRR
jgi:membrane protein